MAGKVTTLYVEDTIIRLMVARGRQVLKWASAPLESGLVSDGVIIDEAQVAERIKELLSLTEVRSNRVIAGINGLNTLYRLIVLPELPEAVFPEAVRREAIRVVPVSLEDVYLSYQAIPAPKGETRIFLAASPRNTIDALVRTLRRADLEPHIMDLAPLALCRVLDQQRAIIVNARLEYLDITVMVDRVPQVIRSLALPIDAGSFLENLPTVTEELDRTVAFYNSNHTDDPLDSTIPVFVSGDLAKAPETWKSLVSRLNCPISRLPSPVEPLEGFPVDEFIVNVGLAIKNLSRDKEEGNFSLIDFNALPQIYLPQRPPLSRLLIPVGTAIGVGVLIFQGFLVQNANSAVATVRSQVTALDNSNAQQAEDIVALGEQIPQVGAQLEPIAAAASIFANKLANLEEGPKIVNSDLRQIVALLPLNVELLGVDRSSELVEVVGTATDEDQIFDYAVSLRRGGRFSAVIISSIEQRISYIMESGVEREVEEFKFEFLLK